MYGERDAAAVEALGLVALAQRVAPALVDRRARAVGHAVAHAGPRHASPVGAADRQPRAAAVVALVLVGAVGAVGGTVADGVRADALAGAAGELAGRAAGWLDPHLGACLLVRVVAAVAHAVADGNHGHAARIAVVVRAAWPDRPGWLGASAAARATVTAAAGGQRGEDQEGARGPSIPEGVRRHAPLRCTAGAM